MQLEKAIEVFVRGFAAVRSRTHPYLLERRGPLWVLHDAPRKNPNLLRRWEFVALWKTEPTEILRLIRAARPQRYALCVVHDEDGRRSDIEAPYKALGLRYMISEPIFARPTQPVPRGKAPPVTVGRVTDLVTARLVAKTARSAQISETDVKDDAAPRRLYTALEDGRAVGWVSSIRTHPTAAWVANLYVDESRRRRGIGAALMRSMLRDDASRGIRWNVLTASQAGAALYRNLKYQQVGTLQVFVPRRS